MCVAGWVAACAGPASTPNSAIKAAIKDLFMRGPSAAFERSLSPL
jgi:hypothetical protein